MHEPNQTPEVEVITDKVAAPSPGAMATIGSDVRIEGTAASARRWIDMASRFARAETACRVMVGFELIALRQGLGVRRGGDRGSGANPNCSGLNWETFVRQEVGISDDTASTYIRMAEAVKPRLKRLPGIGALIRSILETPIGQLTDDQSKLLADAVHKVADGKTQLEFMFELGIAKLPQGSAAKGGNLGGGRPARDPIADREALEAMARGDWLKVMNTLQVARTNFTLLTEEERRAILAALNTYVAAIKRWDSAPESARNEILLAEIAQLF